MIRPGKPPIADQISAARVLAPVPIILNAAKADVWNAVHTFFTEEKVVARDIERIVANVRNLGIRHEKSMPEGHVTVSIGVATSSSDQDLSHEQLMRQADAALYQAKDGGRNCVRSFS